ncbi:helix-turn-helix domain-containing protein [Desemzia sp. FAM 24101]|uniref:helix-turn-helix domain-containing protein n=1 Tax=unclassified Desemzia TaxID=2685243 RepID=UPI00388553EA
MFKLAKELIIEKDLHRKIIIIEHLLNHSQLTAKELAEITQASQRTVFNDLQSLRFDLPSEWTLESVGNNGLKLISTNKADVKQLWLYYMGQSLGVQLVKQLLSKNKLSVEEQVSEWGISEASLKRGLKELNERLSYYHLQINLASGNLFWEGDELQIRMFYHRLLMPFTHEQFFSKEYHMHQVHYEGFLRRMERQESAPASEEIFGICWFYINCLRNRANCLLENLIYDKKDPLLQLFLPEIQHLYQLEGLKLPMDESFFAFFCFLESWSYPFTPSEKLLHLMETYYKDIQQDCLKMMEKIREQTHTVQDTDNVLLRNLQLFLLKYKESQKLTETFTMEYPEIIEAARYRFKNVLQWLAPIWSTVFQTKIELNLLISAAMIIQTELYSVKSLATVYFCYQGEPAWKYFLTREIQDLVGSRIDFHILDYSDLNRIDPDDYLITNMPIPSNVDKNQVFPISFVPKTNEIMNIKRALSNLYML